MDHTAQRRCVNVPFLLPPRVLRPYSFWHKSLKLKCNWILLVGKARSELGLLIMPPLPSPPAHRFQPSGVRYPGSRSA